MNGNIMSQDTEMRTKTDAVFGSNRMTYRPYILALAGRRTSKASGRLQEKNHTTVDYDVAQKFPHEAIAEALKPTQTELKQVHGVASEFQYAQYPSSVELNVSNMNDTNSENVRAGIMNELNKEWDTSGWYGDGITNVGYVGNPNAGIKTTPSALTFETLVTESQLALGNIKAVTDITSTNLARINFVYDAEIAAILNSYGAGSEVTNLKKFQELFPGMTMEELPSNLLAGGKFLMIVSEFIDLHHAGLPGLWSTEERNHGLTNSSLYTYESTSVRVEVKGAIQEVTFGG